MARGLITAQAPPLAIGNQWYPATPLSAGTATLTATVGDAGNGHYTPIIDGKTLIMALNTDVSVARTITISSVVDGQNRKGDVTAYSVAVGGLAMFGPFKQAYWNQNSPAGLWIDVSHAAMNLFTITLPATGLT
jgi:hypothetical protein